jgi:hypothetical protein
MIDDLIRLMREAGIAVPISVAETIEVRLRQTYGGERIYVASLPKQRRAVHLAKLTKMKLIDMSLATGIPVRSIKRIKNGR